MPEQAMLECDYQDQDAIEISRRIENILFDAGLTVERGSSSRDEVNLYVYWSSFNPYLGVTVFIERDGSSNRFKISLSERCYVKFPLMEMTQTEAATPKILDSEKVVDLGMDFVALHNHALTHNHFSSDLEDQGMIFFSCQDIFFFTSSLYLMLQSIPTLLSS